MKSGLTTRLACGGGGTACAASYCCFAHVQQIVIRRRGGQLQFSQPASSPDRAAGPPSLAWALLPLIRHTTSGLQLRSSRAGRTRTTGELGPARFAAVSDAVMAQAPDRQANSPPRITYGTDASAARGIGGCHLLASRTRLAVPCVPIRPCYATRRGTGSAARSGNHHIESRRRPLVAQCSGPRPGRRRQRLRLRLIALIDLIGFAFRAHTMHACFSATLRLRNMHVSTSRDSTRNGPLRRCTAQLFHCGGACTRIASHPISPSYHVIQASNSISRLPSD